MIIIILYYDRVYYLSAACWRNGYFFLSRSCNFFVAFSRSVIVVAVVSISTGFGFIARDTWRRHSSDGYDYAAAAAVAVSKTTTAFNLKAPKLLPLLLLYNASTSNYHNI